MTTNLDDLKRLRDEGMAAGPGSGRWIKAAQALMDAFPGYYATAKAMNRESEELRSQLAAMWEKHPLDDHGRALTGSKTTVPWATDY